MSKGTTTKDGEYEHDHEYEIDEDGNGKTTSTSKTNESMPHVHSIKDFKVLKAGMDMHDHSIPKFRNLKNSLKGNHEEK